MSEAPVEQPSFQAQHVMAAVADIMRSPVTTVQQNDHAAAAAYLMKHAGASALVVLDSQTDKPIGIITEADIAHAVADGKDTNEVRIRQLMTTSPSFRGGAMSYARHARMHVHRRPTDLKETMA